MGPGDPFAAGPDRAPPERDRDPGSALTSGGSPFFAGLAGLFVGGAFATVWLVMDFGSAMAVLVCSLIGMAAGWAVHGAITGRLDWRAGLAALLRRD